MCPPYDDDGAARSVCMPGRTAIKDPPHSVQVKKKPWPCALSSAVLLLCLNDYPFAPAPGAGKECTTMRT